MRKPNVRVKDVFTTNNCGDCVVVEYINAKKVKVQFVTTGYEYWCRAEPLRKGRVKDLYYPSIYEVGYFGEGRYSSKVDGKSTKEYDLWNAMLRRCYSIKHKSYPRYGGRGITVCKDWYNYQNFAQWCNEQPNFGREGFKLDKDLRILDSKEYSSKTCSFVPDRINTLLISCNKTRGEYPVGIYWNKRGRKFKSQCRDYGGKSIYLGSHKSQEEAFQAYKEYKENLIKQVAKEEYEKGNIIKEVYDNLMKWEVVPFPE